MKSSVYVNLRDYYPKVPPSDRLPATASYHVPYTTKCSWQSHNWWVALQTYDARHAYVYLLEIHTKEALRFGLTCHRRDLYWLYPLSGSPSIHRHSRHEASHRHTPTLHLAADEHIRVLSTAGEYQLSVQPGRHLLFAFVLEWGWTRRYVRTALNYLRHPMPIPINAAIRGQLLTLANLSPQEGLLMDAQIYWPIARITHLTRQQYDRLESADKPESITVELARSAREYIRQNLLLNGQLLRLDEIADHFKVSRGHLSSMHKKHFGQSLQAYLMDQRLHTAYRLLRMEGRTVSETAYQLGFSDVQAFNKFFRKRYGVAPSTVRRG